MTIYAPHAPAATQPHGRADLICLVAALEIGDVTAMPKRKRMKAVPLPVMMAELTFASWDTIARRTWMMAQGTCSPAEYRRMVREKAQAALYSGLALTASTGAVTTAALLAPWHKRATANARRLRRK